jgi:hypothetical protein
MILPINISIINISIYISIINISIINNSIYMSELNNEVRSFIEIKDC